MFNLNAQEMQLNDPEESPEDSWRIPGGWPKRILALVSSNWLPDVEGVFRVLDLGDPKSSPIHLEIS